jgi:hypothetical protein
MKIVDIKLCCFDVKNKAILRFFDGIDAADPNAEINALHIQCENHSYGGPVSIQYYVVLKDQPAIAVLEEIGIYRKWRYANTSRQVQIRKLVGDKLNEI